MKTIRDKTRSAQLFAKPAAILLLSVVVGCGTPAEVLQASGDDPNARTANSGEAEGVGGMDAPGGVGDFGGDAGGIGDSGGGTGGVDGDSGSGGSTDPNAGADCTLVWSSGFETGFPGEWLNYDTGAYSPSGTMPAGRVSAWTIVDDASGEPIYNGGHSYKGWIEGTASVSHRAYPVVHTDLETPLINTFMVYLEADYSQMGAVDWIHFGTWGNADDFGGGDWALHTMSVRDRRLEFAHTSPHSGEYIGPSPRPDFPLDRWVRLTVYIHYEGTDGFVQVWQDGVPMLSARVSALQSSPGTTLTRAHWGMYANGAVTQGIQYNDDIEIWTLDAPLSDLETEPDCYLGR